MSDPKLMSYLQEYVLECPMCQNELDNPKTLECLHSFCMQCIDDHISQTQQDGKFACPVCQCEQDIPEGGTGELESSFIQLSVQKISKVMKSEDTLCTSCAENNAETACYNCGELMCPDCEEKHGTLKATKEHETCPLGDLLMGENLVRFQRERFETCKQHGELKKLFCRKCDVALCNVCVYDDKHQKHDVSSILSKVDDEIKVVEKKMEVLGKDQENHQTNMEVLQEKFTSAQSNKEQVVAAIEASTRELHEMIDNYKAALIGHVTGEATNQLTDLQLKIKFHQNQMDQKARLCKDSTILEELPLGSILPASDELLKKVERFKRPYLITKVQLDRANQEQGFVGRDAEMTQERVDGCLKSMIGYLTPLPARDDRPLNITEVDNMEEGMQKEAIAIIHDVITEHATSPRGDDTMRAMARAINGKWKEKHPGDWKCCLGTSGFSAKSGFSGKKHNLRLEVDGMEIHMFEFEAKAPEKKKKGLF